MCGKHGVMTFRQLHFGDSRQRLEDLARGRGRGGEEHVDSDNQGDEVPLDVDEIRVVIGCDGRLENVVADVFHRGHTKVRHGHTADVFAEATEHSCDDGAASGVGDSDDVRAEFKKWLQDRTVREDECAHGLL